MSNAETAQSTPAAAAAVAAEPTRSTRPGAERGHPAPVVEGPGSESCAAPGPPGPCGPAPNLERATEGNRRLTAKTLLTSLSILDRLLALLVLIAMILGVVIGVYAPNVQEIFNKEAFAGTSIPLVVGMIVMMWPALTKVQYERIPSLLPTRALWEQVLISLVLNWVIAPFVMLACAYAALPDLPSYRAGVIMVGLARCIAMVMIWNQIAGGDINLCAIIVIINSVLQIALYSPFTIFFLRIISDNDGITDPFDLQYGPVAIAVLVFLGIPLALGFITRFLLIFTIGRHNFETRFLPYFSPLALAGLLYTIIIIFAQQARHILDNLGPVFRTIVPLFLYFSIMFSATFAGMWWWSNRASTPVGRRSGYEEAAVQSFTAASNNFELSIAVCVSVFGPGSDQALAATIGPLVEVPVLVSLTWLSIYLGRRLKWAGRTPAQREADAAAAAAVAAAGGHEKLRRTEDVEAKRSVDTARQGGMDRSGTVDLV
ncbi:Arsenic compounds resistance protein 3 [Saitozyma sp. JCM 24511]|nr:Arsenic compounds resistance protein 3 [Saitozyma sp. JCM 24511]